MAPRLVKMAICYDFDGTLAPGNMQEYDFIPQLNLTTKKFWSEVSERSKKAEADQILVYMRLMLEKALASGEVKVTKDAFSNYGKTVQLFSGVSDWFDRINRYAKNNHRVDISHFIISSGLREFIAGTKIAKYFKQIYASSFMYDQHDVAIWPALAINYTTKTQYLFRVNKGVLDVWNNSKINTYVSPQERPMPFSNIVYIGDGSTDVPCMKLVKAHGGHSIAVYKPGSPTSKQTSAQLLNEDRVNFVAPANYNDGRLLDKQVKAIIAKVAASCQVEKMEKDCGPRFQTTNGAEVPPEE